MTKISIATSVIKTPKMIRSLIPSAKAYTFKCMNGETRYRWQSWETKEEADTARNNWISACHEREAALKSVDPEGHHFILVLDKKREDGEVERFFRTKSEVDAMVAVASVELRADF